MGRSQRYCLVGKKTMPMTWTITVLRYDDSTVVLPASGEGPGNWSGASSVVLVDGVFWLAYRDHRLHRGGRRAHHGDDESAARPEQGVLRHE
jgi:hypothetical protein